MVRQHRHGRRPQHLLPPRRPADLPLLAHPGRGSVQRRLLHRAGPVRRARRRGCRRHRACRRALRRHQARARRQARTRRRSALHLGHVRVAAARRVRPGLSRRRRLPQRRPQGPARRDAAGRIDLRGDRRAHLLSDAGAYARRAVRGAAGAPPLRHDRHAALARSRRPVRCAGDALFRRPAARPRAAREHARSPDGRHHPSRRRADAACGAK